MNKIPVAVLGGTGYAGATLCELIDRHPAFELAFATARTRGELRSSDAAVIPVMPVEEAPFDSARVVFSALPHGVSAQWVEKARAAGARVVDLSSDLRPGSGAVGIPYGLTELARDEVRGADVVANPGCYPTAVLLALAPLLKRGLIAPGATISATAASGVTGAGASPKKELMFAEVADNYRAYGVGNAHRHLPEMRSTLGAFGADVDLIFTPHLLPVARGILATCTVPLTDVPADPLAVFRDAYAGEPFVEVVDALPTLADVQHRNVVRLTARRVEGVRTPTLLVFAAIDNLVKGAAGQALQNANLMLGLDEAAGLPR